jgi:hypothetical protein
MEHEVRKRARLTQVWRDHIATWQDDLRALREAVGEAPRERLAWLLDEVVYGADVADLPNQGRLWLWRALAYVVEGATEGRWRIGGARWSASPSRSDLETVEAYTSRDADRAPWQRLEAGPRGILEFGRMTGLPTAFSKVRLTKKAVNELAEAQEAARRVVREVLGSRFLFTWTPKASTLIVVRWEEQTKPDKGQEQKGRLVGLHQWWQAHLADAVTLTTISLMHLAAERLRACSWGEGTTGEACGRHFVATKGQKWCPRHQGDAKRARNRKAQAAHRQASLEGRLHQGARRRRSGRPRKLRAPRTL